MRIYARSVHGWKLRSTWGYLIAADSLVFIPIYAASSARKLHGRPNVVRYTSHLARNESPCHLLLVFHCTYVAIFCRFRVITIYWSKIFFSPFYAHQFSLKSSQGGPPWDLRYLMTVGLKNRPRATRVKNCVIVRHVGLIIIIGLIIFTTEGITNIITRGQSNLTKSASRGANSPVSYYYVPLNSWGRVSY